MKSLGKVRQEKVAAVREMKNKQSPRASSLAGESILESLPPIPPMGTSLTPQYLIPPQVHRQQTEFGGSSEEQHPRKPWMPKLDLPWFDETDVRIW